MKKKLPKGVQERRLKDGKKVYVGRVQVNGKRHTITKDNLKELKKAMDTLKYELENNIYNEPTKREKTTLDIWFDIWLKDYKTIRVKQATIEIYTRIYKKHIMPSFGTSYIDEIGVEQVQRFINKLANNNLSSNTISLVIAVFGSMLKQACINERITKNPFNHIIIPKKNEPKQKNILSLEHEKIFLSYCTDKLYKNVYVMALYTGMRVNEILGLTWNDIDFNKKLIHVRHTLKYKSKDNYYLSTPKSKTSKRDVPMLSNILTLVQEMKTNAAGANDFVFNQKGKPLAYVATNIHLDKILKQMQKDGINIKHLSMHSFRHTFATRCIKKGIQPNTLKVILGHSSLTMTMDLYTHVEEDTKQIEMQKLESII